MLSRTVRTSTVGKGRQWVRRERGRAARRVRLCWLEIDRNKDAGSVPQIGETDPLLCQRSQELVAAEPQTVHLEGQTEQGVRGAIRTLPELVATRELSIRRDHLLHDDGDMSRVRRFDDELQLV